MPPDEPTDEEKLEELPEDNDTPFSPSSVRGDVTRPEYDGNLDQTEIYQQGIKVEEPNAGNTVQGYDPKKDQRLK